MARLEKEKFDLYKEISDTEAGIDYSAGELSKLRLEIIQLRAREAANEVKMNGTVYAFCPYSFVLVVDDDVFRAVFNCSFAIN